MAETREDCQRQLNSYIRERDAKKNNNAKLRGEIERLKAAKRSMDRIINNDLKPLEKKTSVKNLTSGYEWRGANKTNYDGFAEDISKEIADFEDNADKLRDAINTAITNKENQLVSSDAFLSTLQKKINNLLTKLENWVST